MKSIIVLLSLALSLSGSMAFAETVKDREGAVRADRTQMENDFRWIYNDIDRGFAEAKKTGKPLLVVLRCVPCKACMGIDASILTSRELAPLLDQFVCVRVINANTLDLSLFQFDYDLSFSTMFFNADRTIYGRYGSWQHQRDHQDATTAGYKAALEATLQLHKNFAANKTALASKQGGESQFKVPVEIPTLAGKYERELNWGGKVVQSCVHCHQIGDAYRAVQRKAGKPLTADMVYPMPAPETIGLTLDPAMRATIQSVASGSAADKAGLQSGDDLLSINDTPLISIADMAWVLHRSPDAGELKVTLNRKGAKKEITMNLAAGWRLKTDISTRVATWPMRAMATGGLKLGTLPDDKRKELGLAENDLGLNVDGLGNFGPHAAAKQAGFLKGDILLTIESVNTRMNESELIGFLLMNHPKSDKLKTTVLREKKRVELILPMQ